MEYALTNIRNGKPNIVNKVKTVNTPCAVRVVPVATASPNITIAVIVGYIVCRASMIPR